MYRAAWAKLKGIKQKEDLDIGNVYLPDSGKPGPAFEAALELLREDVEYYQQKPGSVILLGDFNAKLGNKHTHRHPRAPSHGEDVVNPRGKALLDVCLQQRLFLLSSQTAQRPPTAPATA